MRRDRYWVPRIPHKACFLFFMIISVPFLCMNRTDIGKMLKTENEQTRMMLLHDGNLWTITEHKISVAKGNQKISIRLDTNEFVFDAMLSDQGGLLVLTQLRVIRLWLNNEHLEKDVLVTCKKRQYLSIVGDQRDHSIWLKGIRDLVKIKDGKEIERLSYKDIDPDSLLKSLNIIISDNIGGQLYIILWDKTGYRYSFLKEGKWIATKSTFPEPSPVILANGYVVRYNTGFTKDNRMNKIGIELQKIQRYSSARNLFIKTSDDRIVFGSWRKEKNGLFKHELMMIDSMGKYDLDFSGNQAFVGYVSVYCNEKRIYYWPARMDRYDVVSILLSK